MWERFSYYGMRAFLHPVHDRARSPTGGHRARRGDGGADLRHVHRRGLPDEPAGRLDRGSVARPAPGRALRRHPHRRRPLLAGDSGARRRSISACVLIVLGTGLLKPNISVDRRPALRPAGRRAATRRSRSSTWASTSARSSARSSPAICAGRASARGYGWGIDPNSAWHWGFGAAGVGMTLGLDPVRARAARTSATAGLDPAAPDSPPSRRAAQAAGDRCTSGSACWSLVALRRAASLRASCRSRRADRRRAYSYVLLGRHDRVLRLAVLRGGLDARRAEAARTSSSCSSSPRRSSGRCSSRRDRRSTSSPIAARDNDAVRAGEFPSSWWQSVNAMFIIILAPLFAWLWIRLGTATARRRPTKFALGLIGVGLGFLVLVPGAPDRRPAAPRSASCWLFMVVPAPHGRRAVPEPGRPERDDQARARAYRQPDDGRLVPRAPRSATSSADRSASFYEIDAAADAADRRSRFCRCVLGDRRMLRADRRDAGSRIGDAELGDEPMQSRNGARRIQEEARLQEVA